MKTICITGLDGSGKSTQAKLLAEVLPNSRIVSVWDIIQKPEFQDWTIYQNPPNVTKYVVHLENLSRTLFIFHAFNEAYHKALQSKADYLIFDGYWLKYWAIEAAMGAPLELQNFLQKQYATPDWTFYLQLPVAELLRRKNKLSVYETANKNDAEKSFLQIQEKARVVLEGLLPDNTFYIDGLLPEDKIQDKIKLTLNIL